MLYNIVTEQVSQRRVFHELSKKTSVHMWSVILYVKCNFSLVVDFFIQRRTNLSCKILLKGQKRHQPMPPSKIHSRHHVETKSLGTSVPHVIRGLISVFPDPRKKNVTWKNTLLSHHKSSPSIAPLFWGLHKKQFNRLSAPDTSWAW